MAGKLNNESKVGLGLALSAPPHEGGVDMVLHAPRCVEGNAIKRKYVFATAVRLIH